MQPQPPECVSVLHPRTVQGAQLQQMPSCTEMVVSASGWVPVALAAVTRQRTAETDLQCLVGVESALVHWFNGRRGLVSDRHHIRPVSAARLAGAADSGLTDRVRVSPAPRVCQTRFCRVRSPTGNVSQTGFCVCFQDDLPPGPDGEHSGAVPHAGCRPVQRD